MPAERERLAQIKSNLKRRAQIYDLAREFFRGRGFLEVETPVRVPVIAPEINITPIESDGWYLITSPELHMKRLLAAGYSQIFQISRCFRKGERGRLHNPEFSLLEWYRAGAGYMDMISDTEQLIMTLVKKLRLGVFINYQGTTIDLSLPWPRLSVKQAFLMSAGWDPVAAYDASRGGGGIDPQHNLAIGQERDGAAVERPSRVRVVGGQEREAARGPARGRDQPQVGRLGVGLRIDLEDGVHHLRSVG